ncbi:hypothetical protein M5W98_19225 [Paenibacillus apiarius]|nr:hypothetical protein [Paenibacillus apiarius]
MIRWDFPVKKSLAKEKSVSDCKIWPRFAGGADRSDRPRPENSGIRICSSGPLRGAGLSKEQGLPL